MKPDCFLPCGLRLVCGIRFHNPAPHTCWQLVGPHGKAIADATIAGGIVTQFLSVDSLDSKAHGEFTDFIACVASVQSGTSPAFGFAYATSPGANRMQQAHGCWLVEYCPMPDRFPIPVAWCHTEQDAKDCIAKLLGPKA